ncbi:MAG: hypothetical protein BMS9Abin19_0765 [Gammaproteobacteria bacterium]|nr:MAG: hypothetical protein BMS9Abin19_0765 [Gammaproteobacteria bacterium]
MKFIKSRPEIKSTQTPADFFVFTLFDALFVAGFTYQISTSNGTAATIFMTPQLLIVKILTMSINVQFFASLRELLGKQQVSLNYSDGLDVSSVWQGASNNVTMPDNTLCAINMEYVKTAAIVKDGDEVAFFPPVTGG